MITSAIDICSRFTGCLLGVAVGDALGQPVEAFPPDRLKTEYGEVRDFMDGDPRLPMPLKAGQWTDDTQMTIDIARSILRCRKVDPEDIAHTFITDHEAEGIRFSGFTIKYSLMRLRNGIPWHRSGLDDEQTAGNGSAMRVAPVGLLHHAQPDQVAEDARLSSIMTHRHSEAVAGSIAIAYLVARAAGGTLQPQSAARDAAAYIGHSRVADHLLRAQRLLEAGTPVPEALAELKTSGYVVHTVAAAVYCFAATPHDFERSIIDAVMGGNDADTTAAVAGAVSGAFNGEAAIPHRWRTAVERGDEIRSLGASLYELAA
jgi:ADP-ribosylglycohydrolase